MSQGKKSNYWRWTEFALGIFVMSLGIALTTQAGLGTSPVSTFPLALSIVSDFSFGQTTFFANVLFLALQWCILRKEFPLRYLIQLPAVFFFGLSIDACMGITSVCINDHYAVNVVMTLLGNLILALGIVFLLLSNVSLMPGEGLMYAVTKITRWPFSYTKIGGDLTLVALAVLIEFPFTGNLLSVHEGTLLSALTCGLFIRMIQKIPGFKRAD